MTPIAIVFFIIAAVLVWGGLTASIIYLVRHNRAQGKDSDGSNHVNGPVVPDGPSGS